MRSTYSVPTSSDTRVKRNFLSHPAVLPIHSNANGDVTGASISEGSLQGRAWIPSVEIRFRSTEAEHSAVMRSSADDSYSEQFNFRNDFDVNNFRTRIAAALDQLKLDGM